jgi:hypothetical protein
VKSLNHEDKDEDEENENEHHELAGWLAVSILLLLMMCGVEL